MNASKALQGWSLAGAEMARDPAGAVPLLAYSRRAAWTPIHTVAAAGGALLAYACHGFSQVPVVGSKATIDLVGNPIFAALAITLLVLALRKEQKHRNPANIPGTTGVAAPG